MSDTYFPLLVKYSNKDMPEKVNSPNDLKSGEAFVVLETNYTGK